MASNTQLDASTTTGDKIVTKQVTHDGDTAKLQQVSLMVVSGAEDAYTATDAPGGAGAVNAGTPRITLASDDPAVTRLGEVQASPTANTVLDRLKTVATNLTSLLTELQLKADLTETQPVSAASLPLPSGAATAAKQPALGTAGTPSADVISIQGVASGTVVPVSDNGGALTVDGTVAVSGSVAVTGTFFQATQPVSAAALPLPSGAATSALQGGGLPAALGTGGGLKVDGSGTALPVSGTVTVGSITAGDNNIGNVDLASAIPAGTNAIGKLAANSGVDIGDVDVTTIAAGANLIGDVGLQPRTSGGLSFSKLISAATTNLTQVKATAGQVYAIYATNINAAIRYLKLYNLASASVTVGTTVPDLTLPIPANAAGAGFFLKWPQGVAFGTGISFALTTGVADNDTGAVAANELTVHFFYK